MKERRMYAFPLCLLALLFVSAPRAQERTASGDAGTQMTWSALSTKVDSANHRTDAVNTRVDQVVVCGRKGMTYAPGAPGVDSQGCMAPQNITKLLNCGSQGAVYSAATDSCMQVSKSRWVSLGTSSSYPGGFPTCGNGEGIASRLCANSSSRCARTNSSSATTYVPGGCSYQHFGDSQNCWDGRNVTTTTTWYEMFACE